MKRRGAFTLVELVMVVMIIGTISAIAVPRISGAVSGATGAALHASLVTVRKAIDSYYAEHGRYPGYDTTTGSPNNAAFVNQLSMYTDDAGNVSASFGDPFLFGPYLRPPFPKNPVNGLTTVAVKAAPSSPDPAVGAAGWVAVLSHGYFVINATDTSLGDIGIKQTVRTGLLTN